MTFSRRREIWLLLLVFAIIGLGYAVVWQSYLPTWRMLYNGQDWRIFLAPALMLPAWIVVSIALSVRRCRETILMPLLALLTGVGLLFLLRLAGGTYTAIDAKHGLELFHIYHKQLVSFGAAWAVLLLMILVWRDYRVLARYKYLFAATAVGLLLVMTVFGHVVGGQTISLKIGPLSFQPHDPVKLLLVIFMAAYLVEKQELISFARGKHGLLTWMDFRYMGPLVLLWLLMLALIFIHEELGAVLLLYGSFLGVLYLGTERKVYVIIGLALAVVGVFGGFKVAQMAHLGFAQRMKTRIAIWEDPWQYRDGKGYQICQALMAFGNGRVVGAGLAGGYPERIPAIQTDMIYAAISEDLGLLGAVALLGIFLVVISRMFIVALRTEHPFGKLLVSGLAVTLAVQTWVILAGVTKLIPLTGITLPFISSGGTSLIMNTVLIGIVLKVAEEPREPQAMEGLTSTES